MNPEITLNIASVKDLIHKAINSIEETHLKSGLTGLPTSFGEFDALTGGLRAGELIVIGGRPSTGKSALVMNIVEHLTLEKALPVGVFNMEMSPELFMQRMLASCSRIDFRYFRPQFLAERDFPRIAGVAGKLAKAPLYLETTPELRIGQLRSKARAMIAQYGIKLFVVDYLQLVKADSVAPVENREQEITCVVHGLKAMALELNVAVVALSQLNRTIEIENRLPRLSDLRDSGEIAHAADVVGFLYRPIIEDGDEEEIHAMRVNLLVAKQRNGASGEVPLVFLRSFTRFETPAKPTEPERKHVSRNANNQTIDAITANWPMEARGFVWPTGIVKSTLFVECKDKLTLEHSLRYWRVPILECAKAASNGEIEKVSMRVTPVSG